MTILLYNFLLLRNGDSIWHQLCTTTEMAQIAIRTPKQSYCWQHSNYKTKNFTQYTESYTTQPKSTVNFTRRVDKKFDIIHEKLHSKSIGTWSRGFNCFKIYGTLWIYTMSSFEGENCHYTQGDPLIYQIRDFSLLLSKVCRDILVGIIMKNLPYSISILNTRHGKNAILSIFFCLI